MDAVKSRPGVREAAKECAVHALLFAFTLVLVLKLHHLLSSSWWLVFSPLWLFHVVVARGRFAIPAPTHLDAASWSPFHAVVAMPLLIAFELLLCIHLENSYVNHVAVLGLNVVFLPVYLLEAIIIIDNLSELPVERKLGDDILTHYFTTWSMPFILAATLLTVWIINDATEKRDFFLPFAFLSIGQIIAVPAFIYREKQKHQKFARPCIGVLVMIVLIFGFQVLLVMYLQGIPARIREFPIPYIFSPLFLLQGLGVVFSTSQLVETTLLLLQHSETGSARYFKLSPRAREFLELMRHGSGFPGWWSLDEASKEAQAQRIHYTLAQEKRDDGCNTFCGNPPDIMKKMSKKDLFGEVLNLQAAISKQMKVALSTQQEYEWLQHKKILCRICFQREIEVVLFPCRHRILCGQCSRMFSQCPHCCAYIRSRMDV